MNQDLFNSLVDISQSPASLVGRADIMLEKARWASTAMEGYNRDQTMAIVNAIGATANKIAADMARKTVDEAGFGVMEHKKIKNELTSIPLVDYYRNMDFVNPRIDEMNYTIEIPRPAGVIFALVPSTNPIATINFKTIISLLTRNAIVISPHPAVKNTSVEAVHTLMESAEKAGAPAGIIQILEEPSIPLVEAFMTSRKTNVILATGGTSMVRSAYSSSNPAIGVGPGNVPVFVDETANHKTAAERIVTSKSFDNSILCTNESVLITIAGLEQQLLNALKTSGAYICTSDEVERVRSFLFHQRGFNIEAVGRDAAWIAKECGFQVSGNSKILVTPISQIGVEEDLSKEKLCPVLSFFTAKSKREAINQARAVLRLAGAGHSAAIHSKDELTIMDFASAVEVYRVVVNAPSSQGAAGFGTGLPPTFTIGTGYFGRSTIGDNIGPQHLIHWTRIAHNSNDDFSLERYRLLGKNFRGPFEKSPEDGVPGSSGQVPESQNFDRPSALSEIDEATKNELRRLIASELRNFLER